MSTEAKIREHFDAKTLKVGGQRLTTHDVLVVYRKVATGEPTGSDRRADRALQELRKAGFIEHKGRKIGWVVA